VSVSFAEQDCKSLGDILLSMLYISMPKSARSAAPVMHHNFTALPRGEARRASQPQLHPSPHHPSSQGRTSGVHSTSPAHAESERSDPELRLRVRWHGQHAFLAHDHSTPFQDQITKDMSHPREISARAQVWSQRRQQTLLLWQRSSVPAQEEVS